MEDLFREILAPPSPTPAPAALPLASERPEMMMTAADDAVVDWESEVEMQRLLDMLPNIQSTGSGSCLMDEQGPALGQEFDLESEWDLGAGVGVGVF